MLTIAQAAKRIYNEKTKRLGVSRQRVQDLIKSGRLRAERFGKAWAISEQALTEYKPMPNGYPKGRPRK